MKLSPYHAFHKAYLDQQGIELTTENVKDFSLLDEDITVLGEVDDWYILAISPNDLHAVTFIDAVKKDGSEMQTINL